MYDITDIKNYILFLKRECHLSVTLHVSDSDDLIINSDLISFNIHDNSYCIYVKTCEESHQHCIDKQSCVANKCVNGSYIGTCYAGVTEFIYPIKHYDDILGFISVSGYRADNGIEYIKSVSQKYELSEKKLLSAYKSLNDDIPPKEKIDTLIMPLCNMLELAYIKTDEDAVMGHNFCENVIRYLKKNHTRKINSKDICDYFSCSRSHLSHSFNKHMGMSIKKYINQLRIEDAKSLLEYSELNVTDIAFSVGFDDSNYFTDVFKKAVGASPSQYRKQSKMKGMIK